MTEFKSEYGNLAEEEYQLTSIIAKWVMLNASRKTNQFNLIRDSCGNQTLLLFAGEKAVDKALLLQVFTNLSLQQRLWEQLCAFLDSEPNGYILKDGLSVDQAPESVEANRIMGAGSSDELTEFSGESGQENREETPVDDPDTEATVTRQPIFRSVAEPVHVRRSYVSTRGVVATLLLLGGFFGYMWWPKSDPTAPARVAQVDTKAPAAEPVSVPAQSASTAAQVPPITAEAPVVAEPTTELVTTVLARESAEMQRQVQELKTQVEAASAQVLQAVEVARAQDEANKEQVTELKSKLGTLKQNITQLEATAAQGKASGLTNADTLVKVNGLISATKTTLERLQVPQTVSTSAAPPAHHKPVVRQGPVTPPPSRAPVFTDAPVVKR